MVPLTERTLQSVKYQVALNGLEKITTKKHICLMLLTKTSLEGVAFIK